MRMKCRKSRASACLDMMGITSIAKLLKNRQGANRLPANNTHFMLTSVKSLNPSILDDQHIFRRAMRL